MEESKELKNLYSFLQGLVYITIFIEAFALFGHSFELIQSNEKAQLLWLKFRHFGIYSNIFYSKFFTLALIVIVSIGTKAKKKMNLKLWKHILLPLSIGAIFFFCSVYVLYFKAKPVSFCPLTLPT